MSRGKQIAIVTETTLAYDALDEALSSAGAPIGLAEIHGTLCAAICVGGMDAGCLWVEDNLAQWSAAGSDVYRLQGPLLGLQLQTWQRLAGQEMAFVPLLPDEDDELSKRAYALSMWCHGFVSGLGLAGYDFTVEDDQSGEIAEIVGDFAQISRAALDAEEDLQDDQAEFSLAELVEYVRVGVQIVYEELSHRRGDLSRQTLH
ncbi:MAG: UPF0149 family protein [Gammaproteobacteria bacterium]|nr:UPF0149 family protein [Gammaproteobacteria bacterium]